MIEASVNEGEVKCRIKGMGVQVLSEITVLVNAILDKMSVDKAEKEELVEAFCKGLNHINEREN